MDAYAHRQLRRRDWWRWRWSSEYVDSFLLFLSVTQMHVSSTVTNWRLLCCLRVDMSLISFFLSSPLSTHIHLCTYFRFNWRDKSDASHRIFISSLLSRHFGQSVTNSPPHGQVHWTKWSTRASFNAQPICNSRIVSLSLSLSSEREWDVNESYGAIVRDINWWWCHVSASLTKVLKWAHCLSVNEFKSNEMKEWDCVFAFQQSL